MKAWFTIVTLLGLIALGQASWFPFGKIYKVISVGTHKVSNDINDLRHSLREDLSAVIHSIKSSRDLFDANNVSGSLNNIAAKANDDLGSAISHAENKLEILGSTVQETIFQIIDTAFETSISQAKKAKISTKQLTHGVPTSHSRHG